MEIVRIKQATKTGSTPCIIGGVADLNYVTSKTRRGRVQGMGNISPTITALDNGIHRIEKPCAIDEQNMLVRDDTVGTLTTDGSSPKHNNRVMDIEYRIRKLTPLECYRLMGVDDSDALKMLNVNSNTQCYKQAGNSIVVDVMCAMFRNLNIQGVKTWSEYLKEKG